MKMRTIIYASLSLSTLASHSSVSAVAAAPAGGVTLLSVAAVTGLVIVDEVAVYETSWWGFAKGVAVLAGGVVLGVADPAAATFYDGAFTFHYNSADLEVQRVAWLGGWGADPSLLAPPVDPAGFPNGAVFSLQDANAALTTTSVDDPVSGLLTTTFDWGPAGHAEAGTSPFNFFASVFKAKRNIRLVYLGTSSAAPSAFLSAGGGASGFGPSTNMLAQSNFYVTSTGVNCSAPNIELVVRCGEPETQYFQTYAVPEPDAWMMMIAGFGAMGSAERLRRRRNATSKAA